MNRIKQAWMVLTGKAQAVAPQQKEAAMPSTVIDQGYKITESEAAVQLSVIGQVVRDSDTTVTITRDGQPLFAMVSPEKLAMYERLDGLAARSVYESTADEERVSVDEAFDFLDGKDGRR